MYSVYSSAKYKKNLLLVDYNMCVVNGAWLLEKKNGVFIHPLTKEPTDIYLIGYIDYDGDYNSSLRRFENGEGKHLFNEENKLFIKEIVNEPCKKQYYGIACSCFKCKR